MEMLDLDCDDIDKTMKIIIVGNGNVGKTSMTTRYTKGMYTGNYKKTIGVDFMEKTIELQDIHETVNLMIWDTAGQEEFDALTSRYYKGAGGVIYVFSTVDRKSFEDLPYWQRKVEEECGQICQVLVQNKIDLIDQAVMSSDEIDYMVEDLDIRLYKSCVQDNYNVNEVFDYLVRQYLKYGRTRGSGEAGAVADLSSLSADPRMVSRRYHGGHRHSTHDTDESNSSQSYRSSQPNSQHDSDNDSIESSSGLHDRYENTESNSELNDTKGNDRKLSGSGSNDSVSSECVNAESETHIAYQMSLSNKDERDFIALPIETNGNSARSTNPDSITKPMQELKMTQEIATNVAVPSRRRTNGKKSFKSKLKKFF